RAAARKHDVGVPELAPLVEKLRVQLAALDDGEAGLKRLAAEAKAARAAYLAAAEVQAGARRKGAARLDKAGSAPLAPLQVVKAKFATQLAPPSRNEWADRRNH